MYKPKEHWDEVGKASTIGYGDDAGRFGAAETGGSLYHLPKWSTQPQYWEYMESGVRVLEIGSGNGLQVGRLIQCGVFAVGCDISPALLTIAKGNMISHGIATPMLVQWDEFRLPFASNAFDRVTTNTVLQHVVDDSALDSIFSETARILRSRGLFLVCELVSPRDVQTAPHVKLRSTQTYERVAARHGLHIKSIRHVVSMYVAISSVYARFAKVHSTSSSMVDTAKINVTPPRAGNMRRVAFLTKRVAGRLVTSFAKVADPVVTFLHLGDRFAGQDVIVFERGQ